MSDICNIFNHEYPYTDNHELNLSWVIRKIQELNKSMDELEERVLNKAIEASQEYIDEQMVSIRADFNALSQEVADLRTYFDAQVATLNNNYTNFVNAIRNEMDRMSSRITAFENEVNQELTAFSSLMDLKIEDNNVYILDKVAEGLVNVKVINYFTGELVPVQNMFDYLASLHLENPISYTELANSNITYTALAALNMTYTELAVKGNSFINP